MRVQLVLSVVAAALTIGTAGTLSAEAATPSQPAAPKTAQNCPAGIRALPAAGVPRAADRALAAAAKLYPGLNTRGAMVMAADRSAFAGVRGQEVTSMCGKKVASRTVVVQILFPRMLPSASLSESVVFVGRFAHGYRVWFVAH